ncbi:YvrJ family protein [Bacillus coahuilensis]|nr:YvrJ family protein [Bacillus coahuilensis]
MDELTIIEMIGNVGFPIVMTVYLLHRFEKRLERLEDEIHELTSVVRNEG